MDIEFKLPQKIKKFGIDDLFLQILVAKYENEIPWQKEVKNSASLFEYLSKVMIVNLINNTHVPVHNKNNIYYNVNISVDIDKFLASNHEINESEKIEIYDILRRNGNEAANYRLTPIIKERKKHGFDKWISLMQEDYYKYPTFAYLLMRSVFSNYGSNSRRVVPPPEKDTIEWLLMKCLKNNISPYQNLSRIYFLKTAHRNNYKTTNGWKKYPVGSNPSILSAACYRSGWCIAGYSYASYYLERNDFYILFSSGKPVVAIRANNSSIQECQGVGNSSPIKWVADINIFIDTMGFELLHRNEEIRIKDLYSNIQQTEEWWQERTFYWPLAFSKMPDKLMKNIKHDHVQSLLSSYEIIDLSVLSQKLGIKFSDNDYLEALKINPNIYASIDSRIINDNPDLNKIALSAWLEKLDCNDLSLHDLYSIPKFVKQTKEYDNYINNYMSTSIKKIITARPKSYFERTNRFEINNLVEYTANQSFETAVLSALNSIFNNETSYFGDYIFPLNILEHTSFIDIRKRAWNDAVLDNPTFYFAMPDDLKDDFQIERLSLKCSPKMLDDYTKKVKEKPWILTQKNGVPKSVRHHELILNAYLDSWGKIIYKEPYKIWVVVNKLYKKRVYLSYAALCHRKIINSFIASYGKTFNSADIWNKTSDRMKNIPVIQFAALIGSYISSGIGRTRINDEIKELNDENGALLITKNQINEDIKEILNGNMDKVYESYLKGDDTNIDISRNKIKYIFRQ